MQLKLLDCAISVVAIAEVVVVLSRGDLAVDRLVNQAQA